MESAAEAPYVTRPLAQALAASTSPVVILQGPLGSGKTSLVRNEPALSHFYYVTLADDGTFQQARQQPVEWVASLSRPAIIDDAQRLEGLLAAVLQVAPKKPVEEPFFVLVTSRALRKDPPPEPAADALPCAQPPASPAQQALPAAQAPGPALPATAALARLLLGPRPAAGPRAATPPPGAAPADAGAAAPPAPAASQAAASSATDDRAPKKGRRKKKGRKPLKPQRLTLFPLTQAELSGRPGCIVDDLFERDPVPGFHTTLTQSDLRTLMRVGGLPRHATRPACPRPEERGQQIRQDLRAMLDSGAEPKGDLDQLIERSILKKVLASPGLPLSVESVARACYVDNATLIAHLGSFMDGFLVHRLSHLGKKNRKQGFVKTRLHPMDTTYAIEALRAMGSDIAVDPCAFGKVLRALCVNQLVPAAQWASEPTECCHWKQFEQRVRGVDLVLSRKGSLVGIKVRNSRCVRPDTIGALRVLAKDERFVRGFIVYLGPMTLQLTENVWAIPVSALWELEAFHPPAPEADPAASAEDEDEDGLGPEDEEALDAEACDDPATAAQAAIDAFRARWEALAGLAGHLLPQGLQRPQDT